MIAILVPVLLAGGAYAAYKQGWLGHKPGGPAGRVGSIDASAAIQKQLAALQTGLAAEQAALHVAQATSNGPNIALHTANIAGMQIQIQQLQSQLAHAATL